MKNKKIKKTNIVVIAVLTFSVIFMTYLGVNTEDIKQIILGEDVLGNLTQNTVDTKNNDEIEEKSDNLKVIDYTKILGFDKKGLNYLNKIKNSIVIPNGVNTKSNTFKYELQASLIYDLINNTNTFLFELKSKPVIKN